MRQHNIWCVCVRSVWRGMLDCRVQHCFGRGHKQKLGKLRQKFGRYRKISLRHEFRPLSRQSPYHCSLSALNNSTDQSAHLGTLPAYVRRLQVYLVVTNPGRNNVTCYPVQLRAPFILQEGLINIFPHPGPICGRCCHNIPHRCRSSLAACLQDSGWGSL